MEVHHKTYERLGKERRSDLEVLCPRCHRIADRERELQRKKGRKYKRPVDPRRVQIRAQRFVEGLTSKEKKALLDHVLSTWR